MVRLDDYIKFAKYNNLQAISTSDHGNIDNWIEFYSKCKENNIKPILGSEVYLSEGIIDDNNEKTKLNFHLNLYAKNHTGYKNLIKLTTWANKENFYKKPRITFDILKQYSEGLICTSSCVGSIFAYYILNDDAQKAGELCQEFKQLFKDDFYIEFGYHMFDSEKKYVLFMEQIAKVLNIKTVITNDTHYLYKDDEYAHKILMCKGEQTLADESKFSYSHNYYKNYDEIKSIFSCFKTIDVDKCLDNVYEIIDKCEDLNIEFGNYIYPELPIPNGETQDSHLFKQTMLGARKKFGKNISKEIIDRFQYEFGVISKMQFSGYFNMVSDYISWAKNNGIAVGPARGCLSPETLIKTTNGYKKISEVKIGDTIYNRFGNKDTVLNTLNYDCDEALINIKTWKNSYSKVSVTSDHKVLTIKQPFKNMKIFSCGESWVDGGSTLDIEKYLNINNAEWIEAKNVELGDYLIRANTDNSNNKPEINNIDLSKYCGEKDIFDDNFIYEHKTLTKENPLSIRTISKTANISRTVLKNIKNKGNIKNLKKLEEYLAENNFNLDDFINFKKNNYTKIDRFISIDKFFMYFIGYYTGDGWYKRSGCEVGLAFNNTTKHHQLRFFKKYFKSYDTCIRLGHNGKNLIQLIIKSRILKDFIKDIIPDYSTSREIPEFVIEQNSKLLKYLLKGLMRSDGHTDKTKAKNSYDSTSQKLIFQVRDLLESFGYTTNMQKRVSKFENWKDSFKVGFNPKIGQKKSTNSYNDGKYIYCKVKEINTVKNESNKVYDLTVKSDPSYMTSDYIVHNSSAGSLVAYCIDITEVNPLEYDLLFERFLNPDRISFPDIDTDFEKIERETLMKYLIEKYGETGCVQISTKGYLKGKSALKTVASRLGLGFDKYNKFLSPIKDPKIDTVDKIIENYPEIQKKYNTDTEFQNVCELAKKIEGNIQNIGINASGVIICNKDISEVVPIVRTKEGFGTAWSDKIVEKMGLIKYDILGLNNLTVIKETVERIGNNFDIHNIPLNDDNTYKLLQAGYNLGIFQLESDGMKSLLVRLRPENLEHINAIVALYRPGAMQFIDQYIENKNSGNIEYFDERLKPILKDTYGIMVYQEEVMQIARTLAGYSLGEADILRKAIGKKNMELMKEQEEKFISGCENNGVKLEDARVLFDQIVEFANYSFNKSHSVSYAHIAYQTAYLKANYPLEYMTALLNANSDNLDKLTPYIDECYRLGINVLPPDINKSGLQFEHDKDSNAIRFGFNGIKHVGDSSIEPLVLERSNGPIKSFSDLLTRIPSLNKTALESLIKVGAFNNIEKYPYKYLQTLDYMQKAKNKTDYKNGKINLYDSLINVYIKETSKHNERIIDLNNKRKGLTTKKTDKELKSQIDLRIEQIYNEEKNKFEHMEFTPDIQILKDYEMELIGFPISNNPKKEIMELCDFIENSSLEEIKEEKQYDEIFYFMGKIKTIRRCKNGSYFVVLTDEKTDISTFMKGDTYNLLSDKLENTSNYFRICGRLNRSNNPNYDDNLKLESIRYFNTSQDKEIILRMPQTMTIQDLEQVLTNIKNDAILISDDINYRLSILTYDNKKINTKIDYWVSSIQSIGSYILKYNMTVVN